MASSNRHWPSMFKSKPCNNQQWSSQPHDTNHNQSSLLPNNSCARSSSTFSSGCEERSPEPKPRWNPKPEQIRILETIFNSGMVNPPREEIRRIRAQLQEYGQVGDANVFYWFQNRKSRSKHKQRTLQAKIATQTPPPPPPMPASSSSSSSDKASPRKASGGGSSSYGGGTSSNNSSSNNNNNNNNNSNNNNNNNVVVDQFGNSPTSINQCNPYFHQLIPHHTTNATTNTTTTNATTTYEFVPQEPLFFPLTNFSQGLCFGPTHHDDHHHNPHQLMNSNVASTVDVSGNPNQTVGGFSSLLLGDMFGGDHSKRDEVEKFKFQQELSFLVANPPNATTTTSSNVVATPTSTAISTSLGQMLGVGDSGVLAAKSTVFINGMTIEVPVGPFNVKEFGEDAVLIHSASGHPVLTNEWGVTIHPLQHGASYYLVGSVAASPLLDKLDSTPDLLAPGFPYQVFSN
ncbi:WUSCHEL-related homeobox 9 [Bienertia sinuspersici]